MKIKYIQLKSGLGDEALTEIMFEIASARAEGAGLLRFELNEQDESFSKLMLYIIRKLKGMKQKGHIQFFATSDSFEKGSTEAIFLMNKYPALFECVNADEIKKYIYVKL